jgi:hypothetical protein
LFAGKVLAQSGRVDTVAVSILDRMSTMMGELRSCSVTVKSEYDVISDELGLITHSDEDHVYFGGQDKLLINSEGDKGYRSIIYNGKMLTYYSGDKNRYSQVDAPDKVMEMIDHMNKKFGIVFPVADFLYPSFTDDILKEASDLVFLGMTKVDGKDCYHIAGRTKDKTFQFWISDDMFNLPVKMTIVDTDKPMNPKYEAIYTDWQINPELPESVFEFNIPPNARKIKLVPLASLKN